MVALQVASLVLSLAASAHAFCAHNTLVGRAVNTSIHWDYNDMHGPLRWGVLSEDWKACSHGHRQGPINIGSVGTKVVSNLKVDIPCAKTTLIENVHHGVPYARLNGTLTVKKAKSTLLQMHFHTPGEYRLNNEYYVAESHFVFQNAAGALSVLGFLYDIQDGVKTPAIHRLISQLGHIPEDGDTYKVTNVDWAPFIAKYIKNAKFYQFSASLTTPPCTENVSFYVRTQPIPISTADFNKLKKFIKFNARYTQNTLGWPNLIEESQIPGEGLD